MNKKNPLYFWVALCSLFTLVHSAQAQGTGFTYQGSLIRGGQPAAGNYDFSFALFNNNGTNTGQVANTLTNLNVGVTNGLFTVLLDFGPGVFTGGSNWLEIAVRTNGGASFTALNPLQKLTPTPYAIYAPNAGTASSANSVAGSNIVGTILSANIANNAITSNQLASNIGAWTRIGSNIVYNGGNVGIGTNTPGGSLVVQGIGASSTSGAITGIQTSGSPYSGGVVGLSLAPGSSGVFGESDVPNLGGSGPGGGNAGVFGLTYSTNGSALLGQAAAPNGVTYGVVGLVSSPQGYAGYFVGNVAVTGILSGNGGGLTNLNAALTSIGNNNFFTGSAGNAATTGGFNTAYGSTALRANTIGGANNAFGVDALGVNTSGSYDNAFGVAALGANTSGSYNSAFGGYALLGNTSGSGNTAIGHAALVNNTTGDYNTAIGYETLFSNTNGFGNTAIGYNALIGGDGTNNIALGYNAGANFTANESNNIDIGNSGTAGESGVIRIGTPGTHANTIIAGVINGDGSGLTNLAFGSVTNFNGVALLNANNIFTSNQTIVGNVSIGTGASAGYQLAVQGNGTPGQPQAIVAGPGGFGTSAGELWLGYYTNSLNGYAQIQGFKQGVGSVSLELGPGNIGIGTNNPAFPLQVAGSCAATTFVTTSDRNAKEHFQPVSAREVLAKVVALPVSRWNYKEDKTQEHIGPMAQDFHAAFNVGPDDRHITTVDEGGVALAAIQGLNQELKEKEAEIQGFKARLEKLEQLINAKTGETK